MAVVVVNLGMDMPQDLVLVGVVVVVLVATPAQVAQVDIPLQRMHQVVLAVELGEIIILVVYIVLLVVVV